MNKFFKTACVAAGVTLIIAFFSFDVKTRLAPRTVNAVECAASPDPAEAVNAIPFLPVPGVAPEAVMIRKNVYSLGLAEIASLKAGITAMKALPMSNPTSWRYQAAIHGTTVTPAMTSWSTCQHGTQFFLSWHRMYLYFFERILRKKSGNPNLTLPYWNYQTNPVLPASYRSSAAGNPLFDNTRAASINGGGSLPAAPMAAINNALNNIPFNTFQSNLESPHGSIHVAVGGNMQAFSTAGLDPVFWLHHANIDRLWEAWLKKCQGRANPTTATWRNQPFTFFDENGTAVVMTGSQIVNTATQLNYRYDAPGIFIPCQLLVASVNMRQFQLLKVTGAFRITQKVSRLSFADAKRDSLDRFIENEKDDRFRFGNDNKTDRLMLQLENVRATKLPEGVVEIYLNLPENVKPTPDSKSFVGVLDLFTAAASMHHNNGSPISTVDASQAVRALGLTLKDLSRARLSYVVRGNTADGKEIETTASVEISSTNFVLERTKQ